MKLLGNWPACLILALSALLTQVSAQQLVVQSEKLVGYDKCNATYQKQIYDAWNSAIQIASKSKGDIKFDWRMGQELLGGDRSSPYHTQIKGN